MGGIVLGAGCFAGFEAMCAKYGAMGHMWVMLFSLHLISK
jgi:hypothetical protein